jgi:hypothetical protein
LAKLADAIRHINAQENARELDANELAITKCFPPPPELSPEAQQLLIPFVQWAEAQRVRALPARPCSVAAFAQWQKDLGVPKEKISATLSAIESLHFAASLGNPIATPIVRTITAASTIEPPRSWTKDEKQLFTGLPVEIQAVIARRERDRETQLRRAQNEAGELRRLFKTAAETKPVETNDEKEMQMSYLDRFKRSPKKGDESEWNSPQGSDDMGRDKLVRQPDKGYPKPVDILKKVDPSWERTEGFSAKLDKGKE